MRENEILVDENGERIYTEEEMLEFRGHKFLMDEDGNRFYTDKNSRGYMDEIAGKGINSSSMSIAYDRIEKQSKDFVDRITNVDKSIKDFANQLISSTTALNISDEVERLTKEVRDLDVLVSTVNADIRLFEEMYYTTEFSMKPSQLVDAIVITKNNLKALKELQVSNYNLEVDSINKKIGELKEYKNVNNMDAEIFGMIESLVELEKNDFEVTDWKYKQHKFIEYDKLESMRKLISSIEDKLKIAKTLPYVEKLDSEKANIEEKIREIRTLFKDDMSLEEVNELKEKLGIVSNLLYSFGTDLYYNKENISKEQHMFYSDEIRKYWKIIDDLSKSLKNSKNYENVKRELVNKLKEINKEIQVLSRYVDLHYRNATREIVELDKNRLVSLSMELLNYNNDIREKHLNGQIDDNQYKSLQSNIQKMIVVLNNAKNKLSDSAMIKGGDPFKTSRLNIEEIENGLEEIRKEIQNIGNPIDKNKMKLIADGIGYLDYKIKDTRFSLDNNKSEDERQYRDLVAKLNVLNSRLNKLSESYKNKKPLKVKKVKSGKKVLKKHNKMVLISAGMAVLTLIAQQSLLIPAIIHGNTMIASTYPAFSGVVSFFNKILGGITGAKLTTDGLWQMANGAVINSSVAVTSLLKSFVTATTGYAASLIPILVVNVKKLVEKMKLKEHKQKIVRDMSVSGKYEKTPETLKDKFNKLRTDVMEKLDDMRTYEEYIEENSEMKR